MVFSTNFIFIFIISNIFLGLFGEFIIGKNVLILLVISQFITSCSGSVGYILQMTGKQNISIHYIFSALLNIILNFIFVPKYGITGAAISSLLSMMFRNFVSIYMVYYFYKIITFYIPLISRR